jgi:hypothetical protein
VAQVIRAPDFQCEALSKKDNTYIDMFKKREKLQRIPKN